MFHYICSSEYYNCIQSRGKGICRSFDTREIAAKKWSNEQYRLGPHQYLRDNNEASLIIYGIEGEIWRLAMIFVASQTARGVNPAILAVNNIATTSPTIIVQLGRRSKKLESVQQHVDTANEGRHIQFETGTSQHAGGAFRTSPSPKRGRC